MNFKYLSLVFLCLLVLGSVSYISAGVHNITLGSNCEGMEWIFENQTIKTADDIQTILEQYNCIEEQNAQESALTKYSVKQFNLRNKTFIEIASEAKLTTFQNSPTRKSFYLENGSKVLERKVLNNIDTIQNKMLDCDILSCTWKTEITPAQTMRLKPEDISGGFQFGQATYSAPYYLKNETYNVTIAGQAIYEYSNFTDENGTARTDATIVGYEESTTEQRVRTVKDYDISSLIMEKGKTYIFYIDFHKSSPAERVDIYDTILGVENKELAWWNSTWSYAQLLNTSMLFSVSNISTTLSNYPALVILDTTNSTLFNTTANCQNVRFTDSTNTTELNGNYTGGCGTTQTYYFVQVSSQTASTQVTAYAGNLGASALTTGTLWTGANIISRWDGASLNDGVGSNNLTATGSATANTTVNCRYGGCINLSNAYLTKTSATFADNQYTLTAWSAQSRNWAYLDGLMTVGGNGQDAAGEQAGVIFATSLSPEYGITTYLGGASYPGNLYGSASATKLTFYASAGSGTSFATVRNDTYNSSTSTALAITTDKVVNIGRWSGWNTYDGTRTFDEIRLYSDNKTQDWLKAEYALAYQDSGVWQTQASPVSIVPSILNATNGTYFTVSNDLYGWIANNLDGLSNVSYTWWNGSTAYSSGTVINITGNSTGISHNIANISASLLNADDVWILQINGTNGTTNVSDTNSSSITITNTAPIFTNVSFTANGSSYQLGPVQLNFSAQDLDTNNITYFVNWFKNGTNITSYAQTGTMLSGTTVSVTPPVSVYNVSDNWYARVWVTDGASTTPFNNTHNTTIQNYFSSVVAYAPNATSHIYTQAYINFTVNGAQNASARFTLGAQNVSMANSGTGNNYEFYNTTIVPPAVSEPTNYEGVWYYRAILSNGSYYELTTNQSVNVGTNGFFICNATINTTAIEYTMLDSFTLLPVNASVSLLTEWLGDDGSTITKSLSATNETVYICVTPSTFNRQATISESISATGYLPAVTFRSSQNYSSDVTQRTIYLTNSSSGSVYTFQTLNQFGGPVSGATVKIMQGSTTIFIGITDETGSALAPLTELNIYQVIASATGYSNSSFNFVAGATTTIPITLISTSASNITAPNYQEVFNEVQFTIAPTTRFFSSPTNITYTISSPNSTLGSWGFFITSNGTVVNTQTSTTTTGGSLYYTVNQTGTYILNIWFKADGFANYTPPSYFFTYGNTSGVSAASENLQNGSIISGFGFYLLAVIFAMMGALWISQYSPEGAAIVGLLILCAFTFMWSDAIVLQTGVDELGQPTGITSLMATGFVLLTTLSAFYLRQYGA